MVYFQKKINTHYHKWMIDGYSGDKICLCGLFADAICVHCQGPFSTKQNNGGKKIYCSRRCANIASLPKRIEIFKKKGLIGIKNAGLKKCNFCGNEYKKTVKYSTGQWLTKKYCSFKCRYDAIKIRDGMTNSQRYRRKMGKMIQGTPQWLEQIRARTKEAMYRPEVNAKLHKSRQVASLESRIRHSNLLAGRLPKNMMFGANSDVGCFANVQRGDYENSKGSMYFRSKWEANYALFLDFLIRKDEIKDWQYEPDVFIFEQIKFGTRSYRPDFKVFNKDGSFEYHEVKGWMDGKSKTKLKRMAKYYPDAKIVLVDSIYYNDLKKKMGRMLGFY